MRKVMTTLLVLFAALLSAPGALANGHEGATAMLTGSVIYRERIALPPGALVSVRIEDVSRADAPSILVAESVFPAQSGPPFAFAVEYNPADINPRHRYSLRASIVNEDRLLFTSTQHYPAFASEQALEILVERVRAPRPMAKKSLALPGSRWELRELEGQPAPPGAGGRQPDLEFLAQDRRVGGFAGCNRFMGSYKLNGPDLNFGQLGSTMMACPDGMALEQYYMGVLAKVSAYTVIDEELVLLDESGSALARYQRLTTP